MWEQIRANRRKSAVLIVVMAFLLIALGYAVGVAIGGQLETGAIGVLVAVVIWIILCLTAFAGGDSIMLATAGARRLERNDMPRLFNIVEEMTIASGLPKMPEIYLIDSNVPNAFAVGKPDRAAVAVTTGLVSRLSRDELQGVVAHEIGHIRNYDCRFMVLAGVMVGAIVLISDIFLRSLIFGGAGRGRSRSSSRGGGGGGQIYLIIMIVAIAMAILAPIFAHLIYFACSRRREYLADASSARFTRFPAGLASALEKISGRAAKSKKTNRVLAPMYIVNPMAARGSVGLFSTHPPTDQRVQVLRSMAGGASYAQYEQAFNQVSGGAGVVGASALTDQAEVGLREASAPEAAPEAAPAAAAGEPEPPPAARRREARNVILRQNGYRFAECECGTRMKIPPGFKRPSLRCPSCGCDIAVPAGGAAAKPAGPVRARLQSAGNGWQTVQCACGTAIPISPGFLGARLRCRKCNRQIEIER